MNNKEHIDKMIEEALNSVEGNTRALPKPFLLTRINARLNKKKDTIWEKAVDFISSPAIVVAGLCMIIAINTMVVSYNRSTVTDNATAQQLANTDELSTTVATLYDIENTEP